MRPESLNVHRQKLKKRGKMKTYAYFKSSRESINSDRMLAGIDRKDSMDNIINEIQNENKTVNIALKSVASSYGPDVVIRCWEATK